jgi:hypothetical protein
MTSSYARKRLIRSVAKMFREDDWKWLAAQPEFVELTKTSDSVTDMIKLGIRLCGERMKPAPQPVHTTPTTGITTLAAAWPKHEQS